MNIEFSLSICGNKYNNKGRRWSVRATIENGKHITVRGEEKILPTNDSVVGN